MKINDTRKPPYQTTLGQRELRTGVAYELVSGLSDPRYGNPGDLFLAGSEGGAGCPCDHAVNLSSGALLYELLADCRFVPVKVEAVVS